MDPPPPPEEEESTDETKQEYRVLVALDFGTDWTSVAHWAGDGNDSLLEKIGEIRMVQAWPTTVFGTRVPTKISYTSSPKGCRQWGFDIDDNSKIHKWLRVGLEERRTKEELQSLVALIDEATMSNLARSVPPWLYKSPEQTAQDYLRYIAEHVRDDFVAFKDSRLLENVPLDLIVTYPSLWSEANMRRYFNVVKPAFNNTGVFPTLRHIYFVGETDAIAHWGVLSYLRDVDFSLVKKDTSMIVCDTEGSDATVTTAAYSLSEIDNDEYSFNLREVGYLSKTNAGWAMFDRAFASFVRHRLGFHNAEKLQINEVFDETEGIVGSRWRELCDAFEPIKQSFDGSKEQPVFLLHLPRGFETQNEREMGITNGTLRVYPSDLEEMFHPSVYSIIELLSHQIELADHAGTSVKMIALTGNFATHPYVTRKIKDFGRSRRTDVLLPADRLTTARGAIAYVLGSSLTTPVPVLTISWNCGIGFSGRYDRGDYRPDYHLDPADGVWCADEVIRWLFTKGEPIFPDAAEPRRQSLRLRRQLLLRDCVPGKRSQVVLVTSSLDNPPNQVRHLDPQTSDSFALDFELPTIPGTQRQDPPANGQPSGEDKSPRFDVTLSVDAQIDVSGVGFSVSCGEKVLAEKRIAHP